MYAIEADDLSTIRKCRMICYRLFGGTTTLTYCYRVFTKAERENSNDVYQKKNTSIKKEKEIEKNNNKISSNNQTTVTSKANILGLD